jgi:cysteine desulfurase
VIEQAREQVASLVGAAASDVVFAASATEANMLALSPAIETADDKTPRDRLLMSAIEHTSVRSGGRFARAAIDDIPVLGDGRVDLVALAEKLSEVAAAGIRRPLVSIMLANNETGVVQPVSEAARIVHEIGGLLHVDAVQGPGRIGVDMAVLGADLLTLSSHKLGGPKGVGALVRRRSDLHIADPLVRGGGQERGMRAGTEDVAGIAGFGAAAAEVHRNWEVERQHMAPLRDRLEAGLKATTPDAIVFGEGAERLPNTTLFAVPGMKAETAVIALDLAGIAVSSGAACSSGKVQSSHVLAAMGFSPALARGAVRVSLGRDSSDSDIEGFLNAWIKVSEALLKGTKGMAA